jgi:hypothetical protein
MLANQWSHSLELEPEVWSWREGLPADQQAQADYHITLLEAQGVLLGEPYTRQLRGKLRELRFYCGGRRQRISYFIATGRRIILLTVFDKQRRRERAEIDRAERAMERCVGEEHAAEEHERYRESGANGPGEVERGP